MINKPSRKQTRGKIKVRTRKKIRGNLDRPRVSVYRSLKHINSQAIDDEKGVVIASASSLEKELGAELKNKTANLKASQLVGETLAKRLLDKGVTEVVFDRNGFLYHGAVKVLADSLRAGGIKL